MAKDSREAAESVTGSPASLCSACSPFPWKCKFGGRDTDDGFTIVDRDGCVVCEWWPAAVTAEERRTMAANVKQICDADGWRDCAWHEHQEVERLRGEVKALQDKLLEMGQHCNQVGDRVWKLVDKQRQFIVIGEHEPYYMDAYAMIRDHEMSKGTWTEEDRVAYASAQLSSA